MHGNLLQKRYTNFCGDHKNEKKNTCCGCTQIGRSHENLKKVRKNEEKHENH
jgi:hypothetical protein